MIFSRYLVMLCLAQLFVGACHNINGSSEKVADSGKYVQTPSNINTNDTLKTQSYQTLQAFWPAFQQAIQENNSSKLITLTHFPLPGITPFIQAEKSINPAGADTTQFISALPDILGKVLREQALKTTWDSLLIVDQKDFSQQISGGETLLQTVDADSKIYLCYAQWANNEGKESNQAFIFAKIKGNYKLCAIAWRGGIY